MCIYQDDMRTALRFAEYTRYVSISYDGRVIAARSPNSAGEKVTRFLRAPHGQTLSVYAPLNQRLTLSGHSGLTRDGSLAALLYDDCDVHVVETATGTLVARARFEQFAFCRQVAFSADGNHLVLWHHSCHYTTVWRFERLAHLQWLAMRGTKLWKLGEGGVDRTVLAFLVTH